MGWLYKKPRKLFCILSTFVAKKILFCFPKCFLCMMFKDIGFLPLFQIGKIIFSYCTIFSVLEYRFCLYVIRTTHEMKSNIA